MRLILGALGLALFAFVAMVLWLRYVALPDIESYRADLVASIESASGLAVSVRSLHGGWQGLRPQVSMEGFALAERNGKPVLAFQRAEATLSWYALFLGEVRFHKLSLQSPELVLRRAADGFIYLADKPLNKAEGGDPAFLRWLLSQPRLEVHDATIVWRDEKAQAAEVRLTAVEIAVRREGLRHVAALAAHPPAHLSGRLDVRADLRLDFKAGELEASGRLFAEAAQADLNRLREHLPLHAALRRGVGNVRVWTEFAPGKVTEIVADLNVRDVRAQLAADLQPLELASLAGRVTYRAQPQGFYLGTDGLRLRTEGGVETLPGSFSISARDDGKGPQGELKAEGIDLKVAAALVDYFPLPRPVRESIGHFAPRGRLGQAVYTWAGEDPAKATRFSLRANFDKLAVNAVGRAPGFAGLSGSVEGDEKGGKLQLSSKNAVLEMEHLFRAPLAFDMLEARATWKRDQDKLAVTLADVRFANADAEGRVDGTWQSLPGSAVHSPGLVKLKGSFSRLEARSVADYLPNRLAPTRDYLDRAILGGRSGKASFELDGDLWYFPFTSGKEGRFRFDSEIRDASLRYHPDWPTITAIEGAIQLENSRLDLRAQQAQIFSSRVKATSLVIADVTAQPPVLEVAGEIETAGGDSARFLRESPLFNGPGAFTRTVAIEGPAHLALKLNYPLYGTEPARVNGEYTFKGATAAVGKSLSVMGVKGKLFFTEKSVRAPELTGTMFNQPVTVRLATEPDGSIATALEGRIATPILGAFVPDAIASRLEGNLAWRARLSSTREGSQLAIESDLAGLASRLPEPFAKPASEARPLAVTIRQLGTENEVSFASLAKGATQAAVTGRFGSRGAAGAERWHAALQFGGPSVEVPVKDGIWLYGALDTIDLDAWHAVFPAVEGAAQASDPGVGLQGFDLKLGNVWFTGRAFTDLHAKLQRDGAEWRGSLDSPRMAGDVAWSAEGRGRVAARLSRFRLEPAKPTSQPERPANGAGDMPSLDIVAESFTFKGVELGRLELQAETVGAGWRISRLDITNANSQFKSTGEWRRTATGSISTLDVNLNVDNLNGLLGQFGYGDLVKRGQGRLQGQLAWPGFPNEFALDRLQGSFKLGAERGQFAKIEPGAGKLLGLLSLQSLPRRATLDFRDVFSEGFAFESITATVQIARGILLTDDLEISGPAAFVSMGGEVSLPGESQSLTVRVIPEVGETVALAATALGTPVLGLSTLLVSKLLRNPLGKAFAYEYFVTGTWDNPSVTTLSVPPPKAAAASGPGVAPAKSLTP